MRERVEFCYLCHPCEERWDGPPDLTWEPVSIFIHDKKQQTTPALSISSFQHHISAHISPLLVTLIFNISVLFVIKFL